MKNAPTWIAGGILCVALAGPAMAQNFLDDMIYSAKCSGANDKEACKVKARQDFDNSRQGTNGGRAVANGGSATTTGKLDGSLKCQSVSAKGPTDVDTAYIRAMKTFHFTTQEELENRLKFTGGFVNPNSFKHAKTPGVMYDLFDLVGIPGFDGVRPYAGLTLAKSDKGGTDMEVKYCLGNDDPTVSNQAFWDAAEKAFRSLVM